MDGSPADARAAPRRRRDAAATREAILESALAAFSRSGYDGVGVREIAQAAGVTATLVNRYFGGKERLFAEAVEAAFASADPLGGDVTTLARDVTEALSARPAPGDAFTLMLRSAANPRAARILRSAVERHLSRHLAASLPGARADERAALVLALIAGVRLMRDVLTLPDADPAHVEALFGLLISPE
ncbi:TetR/AcrR family transcriptional regulator [Actinomadura sp. DC4]|uniref:TetR/AcrR family transcriptional regulator n=1 Tax=Actinomadura sp. DC4 TaxID=3055069 RepID=UPI0025B02097|nr:TetR/AcrR family transcriptional regulator [Actinomadura sp. DC4]MDN3358366.1 TetR family transcriptional regulator [Actinomadura sp. DC4]